MGHLYVHSQTIIPINLLQFIETKPPEIGLIVVFFIYPFFPASNVDAGVYLLQLLLFSLKLHFSWKTIPLMLQLCNVIYIFFISPLRWFKDLIQDETPGLNFVIDSLCANLHKFILYNLKKEREREIILTCSSV